MSRHFCDLLNETHIVASPVFYKVFVRFAADGMFGFGLALHARLVYFTRFMQLMAVVQVVFP